MGWYEGENGMICDWDKDSVLMTSSKSRKNDNDRQKDTDIDIDNDYDSHFEVIFDVIDNDVIVNVSLSVDT